ncbi:MAG: DUF5682 family protein, partial [Bacteroidota bacterium]|nr:DUF5682 family protein [Bacteroidota bacterium]
ELHSAIDALIQQINNLAAASSDVLQLMEAIPPLVNVARYGNVRKTDSELVLQIVSSMTTRICIGLPNAVTGINEEAAQNLLELIHQLHDAIALLQQNDITTEWQQTLNVIATNQNTSPVISGYATRLLADYKIIAGDELIKAFHFRMSSANPPDVSAAWMEGFLKGSGSILLVDNDLWMLVNQWVGQLNDTTFTEVLPLLRRTFAHFTPPERRKLGEKVKSGGSISGIKVVQESDIDVERAKKGIPIVLQLLGIKTPSINS